MIIETGGDHDTGGGLLEMIMTLAVDPLRLVVIMTLAVKLVVIVTLAVDW